MKEAYVKSLFTILLIFLESVSYGQDRLKIGVKFEHIFSSPDQFGKVQTGLNSLGVDVNVYQATNYSFSLGFQYTSIDRGPTFYGDCATPPLVYYELKSEYLELQATLSKSLFSKNRISSHASLGISQLIKARDNYGKEAFIVRSFESDHPIFRNFSVALSTIIGVSYRFNNQISIDIESLWKFYLPGNYRKGFSSPGMRSAINYSF